MRTVVVGLLLASVSVCHAHPPFDLAQRALAGDPHAINELVEAHGGNDPTRIIAARGFRTAGEDDRAFELLEEAMRNGSRAALWTRVVHHIERHDWIEGYAWGRLAMLVEKNDAQVRDDTIEDGDWPMEWSWQFTQRAARNLRETDFPAADRRTEELVRDWYELLIAPREKKSRQLAVVRRAASADLSAGAGPGPRNGLDVPDAAIRPGR